MCGWNHLQRDLAFVSFLTSTLLLSSFFVSFLTSFFSSFFGSSFPPLDFSTFSSLALLLLLFSTLMLYFYLHAFISMLYCSVSAWKAWSIFSLIFGSKFSHSFFTLSTLPASSLYYRSFSPLKRKQALRGFLGLCLSAQLLINQIKYICKLYFSSNQQSFMKGFTIGELLIYDPKRISNKRKPIEIDMQEAKIITYWPQQVQIQQKCNTVGMAEGVYSFCHTLLVGKQPEQSNDKQRGWQTIFLDKCTLIVSEVEQDIWFFVKLQHEEQSKYNRIGDGEEHDYLDNSFSQQICKQFMQHMYGSIKMFYGSIRGWVFKQRLVELQKLITLFVQRYQEIYRLQNTLDLMSYALKDIRLIPLDVNSTLKFSYFKNVLQSYDLSISHIMVFAYGLLAYSSLDKQNTEYLANYLYGTGQPYMFSQNRRARFIQLPQMPKGDMYERFGILYNSKVLGLEDSKEYDRSSLALSKGVDLLGLGQQSTKFELFQVWLQGQQQPLRINYYYQNNMFFITFYRQNPAINQIIFQNRFYHDNADKFIIKINESLNGLMKPTDPYKFIFHNSSTYSGKSTIKDWKGISNQIREMLQLLQKRNEGVIATMSHQNCWLYGVHRLSRILVILIPNQIPLQRLDQFVNKMTKQYFSRAYI